MLLIFFGGLPVQAIERISISLTPYKQPPLGKYDTRVKSLTLSIPRSPLGGRPIIYTTPCAPFRLDNLYSTYWDGLQYRNSPRPLVYTTDYEGRRQTKQTSLNGSDLVFDGSYKIRVGDQYNTYDKFGGCYTGFDTAVTERPRVESFVSNESNLFLLLRAHAGAIPITVDYDSNESIEYLAVLDKDAEKILQTKIFKNISGFECRFHTRSLSGGWCEHEGVLMPDGFYQRNAIYNEYEPIKAVKKGNDFVLEHEFLTRYHGLTFRDKAVFQMSAKPISLLNTVRMLNMTLNRVRGDNILNDSNSFELSSVSPRLDSSNFPLNPQRSYCMQENSYFAQCNLTFVK